MKKIAPLVALAALVAATPARALLTDISQSPIAATAAAQTKPNIMLLMDNSGSMGWTHMPDEVEQQTVNGTLVYQYGQDSIGYKSAQCNSLYYNPNTTYLVPKDPSLAFFAASTYAFNSARYAGYGAYYLTPDLSTTNLATSFRAYDSATLRTAANDTPQPAYYYVYSGPQSLTPSSEACRQQDVNTTTGAAGSGGGTWTRKVVSATSGIVTRPDERENFAIWYTYYRTRLALIKSAASLAFAPLSSANSNYRVGFITVDPKDTYNATTINASKFYVPINDFNVAQTGTWFTKLFSQEPKTASPAREGLARVGRHYGGKQDGINAGMTGDPLQYSCQQNFTIMTTDGYWNAQTETPGAGPVALDGVTKVGQMDGTLTADSGLSPSPIWEGQVRDTVVTTDKTVTFSYGACGNFQSMTTVQVSMSTQQNTRTTTQTLQHTEQRQAKTEQRSETTQQRLESTYQQTSDTIRRDESTSQTSASTTQRRRYTTTTQSYPTQIQDRTLRMMRVTDQLRIATSQFTRSTSQTTSETRQVRQSTTRVEKQTTQTTASTTQTTATTSQTFQTDTQSSQTTTQTQQSTEQRYRSTEQHRSCDSSTETCTPVAAGGCTPAGFVYCETANTGPTLVATCTNDTAKASNNYTRTTCTSTTTGPTPVQSCNAAAAGPGNNYTTTTCTPNNTGPTPVAFCTASSASAGNNWTTTTCGTAVTGPTAVGSCTTATPNSSNNYTTTSCSTTTSPPTGVASCTNTAASSSNSWTTTTCGTATTGPTGVSSCSNTAKSSSNNWTATTCNTVFNAYAPASSCTGSAPNAGNSWVFTECRTIATGPTPVASCTNASGTAGNNWTTTSCTNNNSAPVGVQTCNNVAASSSNSWTATVCTPVNTGPVGVASACSSQSPNSGNGWTTTTCNTVNTGPTPTASCTNQAKSLGNNYTSTTCSNVTSSPTAVGSCTPDATRTSSNNYTTTTCNDTVVQNWANAGACTADPGNAGNNWLRRECRITTGTATNVQNCTATGPNGSGQGVGCQVVNTGPTPVASCTPQAASSSNNWVETTCDWNNTGPTFVQTCANATANSGNSFTNTTCSTQTTGPTPVASCTADPPTAVNNWRTTSCNNVVTAATPVGSCTNVPPSSSNGFTETRCYANATGPTPVQSCNNVSASSTNAWTSRTCSNNNTGPTLVGTCVNQTASAGNNWVTRNCTSTVTGPAPAASCTADPPSAANNWVETSCTDNNSVPVPVSSCTAVSKTAGNNWTETVCNTTTSVVGIQTPCSSVAASGSNSWTGTTCNTVNTGPTLVVPGTCINTTANAGNNWLNISCTQNVAGPTAVGSCTPQSANAGNNFTEVTCTAAAGKKWQYAVTTDVTTQQFSGGVPVTSPSTASSTGPVADVNGTCHAPGTEPALPASGRSPQSGVGPVAVSPCTSWPCTSQTQNGIGSVNSLADVAQYYYATDLRPGMVDNVPSVGSGKEDDRVNWQHMTTFVVGLGVSGTLDYRKDYKSSSATTGHFAEIRNMTRAWPVWPDPAVNYADPRNYENPKAIDDFWHTAVNGRGTYFSAGDPQSVVAGLADALAGVAIRTGAGAPLGFSNYQPVTGDNFTFAPSYQTSNWVGDIKASEIDVSTGVIAPSHWSAQAKLDLATGAACDNRRIFLMRPSASGGKVNFSWNSYVCDGSGNPTGAPDTGLNGAEQANFGSASVGNLDHYLQMTDGTNATVNQRALAAGPALVNFVRGQRGNEGFVGNDATKLFRTRTHVLGDIVGSQPVYVGKPRMDYQDTGYGAYKSAQASRVAMVYAGANDGMLHAFYAGANRTDANGGKEAWAFIPQAVLPNLYRLASNNYKNNHQFFVDGTPTVADAYDASSSAWKTVLVGGLNGGGRSFYAIDVTDPVNPKGLWEFQWSSSTCYGGTPGVDGSDCHVGMSYGKPVITKRADGKWVVMVTSGYNNVNSPGKTGDGIGYLYVLDAFTGKILQKIETGVGDGTTPSGLAQINNYVDYPLVNNTTRQVYGGDQLGNVWRFDINDLIAPSGTEAALLGTAKDTGGNPQPITTRPELAEINAKPMVFVGTGQLLGASDFANVNQQSVYGFIDTMGPGPVYATSLRNSLQRLTMTQVGSGTTATRTVACSTNCAAGAGWVIDLPDTGERMNVDMRLARGSLVFATNVPNTSACTTGGYSWMNVVDFRSGLAVSNPSGTVSFGNTDSLTAGISLIDLNGRMMGPRTFVDNTSAVPQIPTATGAPQGRRISWREVAN